MSDQKQGLLGFDWALLFYWMMATTAGWLFGWLLWPPIALVVAGVTAGLVQCLVLFRRIPKAWHWLLATAIGWLGGLAIVLVVVPMGMGALSGLVVGSITGLAQWVLLQRQLRWAGWWIAMSAVAWSVGLSLAPSPEAVLLPRVVLSGTMASVISGITLELLLRNRKPTVEAG